MQDLLYRLDTFNQSRHVISSPKEKSRPEGRLKGAAGAA
jgi:hypothetical protein